MSNHKKNNKKTDSTLKFIRNYINEDTFEKFETASIKINLSDNLNLPNNNTCNNVSSKIIANCESESLKPNINLGFFIVRVPIVISETIVHIELENNITFSKPAKSIKAIHHNIYLTECTLLPQIKKLFLSGYIKKSIEYNECTNIDNSHCTNNLKSMFISVPFNIVTEIEYTSLPEVFEIKNDKIITKAEETIFSETIGEVSKINCNLVQANFEEVNILDENENIEYFKKVTQKMSVKLTIRLTQEQNFNISSV